MNNDPLSLVKRVIDELNEATQHSTQPFEPSPLRWGEDSKLAATAFLAQAEGNPRIALVLLREDLEKRYPGFKAVPGSNGFKCYDRIKQAIRRICKAKPVKILD